jgi:hypothetical protein
MLHSNIFQLSIDFLHCTVICLNAILAIESERSFSTQFNQRFSGIGGSTTIYIYMLGAIQ